MVVSVPPMSPSEVEVEVEVDVDVDVVDVSTCGGFFRWVLRVGASNQLTTWTSQRMPLKS